MGGGAGEGAGGFESGEEGWVWFGFFDSNLAK